MSGIKKFIEVTDDKLNVLFINVNEIQILYCDSKILIKGFNHEIQLEESYKELKQLIKQATEG